MLTRVGRQKRVYGPWIGCCCCSEKYCPGTCARTPAKISCPPGDPSSGCGEKMGVISINGRVVEQSVVHSEDPTGVGGAVDVGKRRR